jgi:N-acetylmuramoyl-L-alanine amidase CwlA
MSVTINTLRAKSGNYGSTRKASAIQYLVYHYTGNKTDTAKNNATYLHNNLVKASAHYFVDENSIYQSVPDLSVAYAVGGGKYSDCATTGGGKLYGVCTNTNSISIEMCSTGGVIAPATIQRAVALGKELMAKYSIPVSRVCRHFDVNGKHCPGWSGWYGKDPDQWEALVKKLSTTATATSTTTVTPYIVRITADVLNVRSGPGTSYSVVTTVKQGDAYTIVAESGGWGKLKSGAGWVKLGYTERV